MEKIKLEIHDLSPSQLQAGSFTLILAEVNGDRRLPIIIGMNEAQAIALELEKVIPSRPITHDLFRTIAKSFDFTVEEVQIHNISEGIFFSKIVLSDGIRQKSVDARPSDAIAIAVRFNAPLYTNELVLKEAGISAAELGYNPNEAVSTEPVKSVSVSNPNDYNSLSLDELLRKLEEAIQSEEYEKAAKIRDEIDRRN